MFPINNLLHGSCDADLQAILSMRQLNVQLPEHIALVASILDLHAWPPRVLSLWRFDVHITPHSSTPLRIQRVHVLVFLQHPQRRLVLPRAGLKYHTVHLFQQHQLNEGYVCLYTQPSVAGSTAMGHLVLDLECADGGGEGIPCQLDKA